MEKSMNRNAKIFAGAAVVLALGSAAAVAHRHGGWHHKGPHGWGGPHLMGMGPLCRGDVAEKADLMMVRLEYRVKLTDAQKPAFEELRTAARSAAQKIAAACPPKPEPAAEADKAKDGKPPRKEITARLAETEAQLTAALEGLKIVRPAAEKLYATLDDAQKKAVSELGMGKRGKWGRHHHRHEGRGPGPGAWDDDRRGPDRGPAPDGAPDDGTPEREGDL
jgi:hypothetical protein